MSAMITFGLLVVFIDCLNGQDIPTHPDPTMIRAKGRTAIITCNVSSSTLQSNALHWYRAQPGGALQRLIYFEAGSTKAKVDPLVVRTGSFVGSVKNQNEVSLTMTRLQVGDAGSYYCALWTGDNKKVFGSGTRLYVTETNADKVTPPTLTGYLPSIKTSGKQTMLCHASDMFPDFLLFTWQKKTKSEDWKEVPKEQILEQTQKKENGKPFTVTSMLVLDEPPAQDDEYKCIAIHEGGTEKAKSVEMKKANQDSEKKDTTSKKEAITEKPCPTPTPEETSDTSPEQMRRLYVFVYAYGVMLMKNGLYFCVVSILLLKRKYGKKEESS
ncbi:immunoglobulin lambda-1 light chain-like isoform X1 [Pseudorasbora parva]|uniref:immunoglobulin lambda-1 light chain-like isoform X1 n=1 Tax=Pseudorasbora parva TaxID=51549 RepID=UPI00351E327E